MIYDIDLHLELLHAALTGNGDNRIAMWRDGKWQVAQEVYVKPSPYPRTDELHYYLVTDAWADYVSMSESTRLLRIVRS